MLLMSRHLTEYNVVPAGAVIRINLAWEDSLDKLAEHLEELTHHVFLDVPCDRKKPPNYHYDRNQIQNMVVMFKNIKYVAISQVESSLKIIPWVNGLSKAVKIVPKIESREGCKNIEDIVSYLKGRKRYIMLDHDDLFQELTVNGGDPSTLYTHWINPLLRQCEDLGVNVLRTAGVVFSDK